MENLVLDQHEATERPVAQSALHSEIDKKLASVLSPRATRAKLELSTSLGRILDRIKYSTLLKLILMIVAGGAVYFFIATSFEHGIKVPEKSTAEDIRWNALYFSIVTFTSLGYGDLAPEGFGKAIASLEVLAGIVLIAIVVGKIASERQSTSLLLLMTSDNQRRLRELEQNLELSRKEIESALADQDQVRAAESALQGISLVASIRKYLTFQANQAQIANFGNASSLRDLYQALYAYQTMAEQSYKLSVARGVTRGYLKKIVEEVQAIAEIMVKFHPDDLECKKTFLKIGTRSQMFASARTAIDAGLAHEVYPGTITKPLLHRVHGVLIKTNFDKNVTKFISHRLGISRNMAQRCVDELIDTGVYRIPLNERELRKKQLAEKLEHKKELVRKKGFVGNKKLRPRSLRRFSGLQ